MINDEIHSKEMRRKNIFYVNLKKYKCFLLARTNIGYKKKKLFRDFVTRTLLISGGEKSPNYGMRS